MTDARPRLLLVGAQPEAVQDLVDLVGDRYRIVALDEDPRTTRATHAPGDERAGDGRAMRLLSAIGEGVALAETTGEISWSNTFFEALEPEVRARVAGACRETAEHLLRRGEDASPEFDPGVMTCKFEIASAGERRLFDAYITLLEQAPEDAGDRQLAVVVRDVTVARKTQRKMDAIDRAGYELARFDVEQIRQMNAMERLELLEAKIVASARELLNYDHFAVFLLDQKTNKLRLVMSAGLPQEIQDLDLFPEQEGSGISGYVAATGRSYVCYDAQTDERYLPGLVGARSSVTVPLRVHDRVIGILDVESKDPGQFDEQDRQFAEIFARHTAMALHTLDLLVAERTTTNLSVTDRFEGELAEPLEDLSHEVEWLDGLAKKDPETAKHVEQIRRDLDSIKNRMRDVASGPQTLLGIDKFREDRAADPALQGKRVLVADDHPKIRKIIGEVLTHRGCDVTVCASGQAAIDELEAVGEKGATPFELVVSDIQMPDRNGYEVFSTVRKHTPGTPVLLMTGFGYDPHHSIVRASQEGLQGVLFKPFEIELLIEQVKLALAVEHAES
ncbi:MAG: response regulator [Phycisphaerales bacterium]